MLNKSDWEKSLREEVSMELDRFNGVRISDLLDGGRHENLRKVVFNAVSAHVAIAIHRLAEIEVVDPAVAVPEPPAKEIVEDKEEWADKKDDITGGSKPPHDGLCRNCRKRVPLNRFKLCYACWVEDEISSREKKEGREWKSGDAHPTWCHCEGLGEHRHRDGSDRRAN